MVLTFKQKVAGVVVAVLALLGFSQSGIVGSVPVGAEYHATSTYPTSTFTRSTIISNAPGTLGSLVISSTTAAKMVIKDATSTTDIASTTVAAVAASAANGTYTYDVTLLRGLILEIDPSFAGGYTVTYR